MTSGITELQDRGNGTLSTPGTTGERGRDANGSGVTTLETARSITADRPDVRVVILNPGKPAVIYASMKQTDKEDGHKPAWPVRTFPDAYLPTVPPPSVKEAEMRRRSKAEVFPNQEQTRLMNHLRALFVSDGTPSFSTRILATAES